jgi:hypothetical protein
MDTAAAASMALCAIAAVRIRNRSDSEDLWQRPRLVPTEFQTG